MPGNWKARLITASQYFGSDLEDQGTEELAIFPKTVEDLPPEEKVNALGTAAQYLESQEYRSLAISMYERLVDLALVHDAHSILTARDLVHIADLYRQIGEMERMAQALEQAASIYEGLSPSDRALLEPSELGRFYYDLRQCRIAIESLERVREPIVTPRDLLRRLSTVLHNDYQILMSHPETLIQQHGVWSRSCSGRWEARMEWSLARV